MNRLMIVAVAGATGWLLAAVRQRSAQPTDSAPAQPPADDPAPDGTDESDELAGLEVIAERAPIEREIRLGTFDSLNVKAGVIAAAAPALVALTADGWPLLVILGATASLVTLIMAIRIVRPRDVGNLDLDHLREQHAHKGREYVVRRVFATELHMINNITTHTSAMADRLRNALRWLMVAGVLLVAGVLVDPVTIVMRTLVRTARSWLCG